MDDMLVTAMGARAGWMDRHMDEQTIIKPPPHTHTQKGSSTFQKGENEEQCQPAITAPLKLYARWDTQDQAW